MKAPTIPAILLLVACGGGAPDPCEVAWGEMEALRAAMTEHLGDAVKAPDQTTFLETCAALPEETRPCLSPRYALEHGECTDLMEAVPEALRSRMQ
jgi:hypothetical protein